MKATPKKSPPPTSSKKRYKLTKTYLGYPTKNHLEELGFTMKQYASKSGYILFYNVVFPEGWYRDKKGYLSFHIYDNKDRCRGYFYVNCGWYNNTGWPKGDLSLYHRYNAFHDVMFDDKKKILLDENDRTVYHTYVKDLSTQAIIFDAGIHSGDTDSDEEAQRQAKNFLIMNYPRWQDPLAYWGK